MLDEIQERCKQIVESLQAVQTYFSVIRSAEQFIKSAEGQIRLDAIIMRLQVAGENIKRIVEVNPAFFKIEVPPDVTDIIRFRDFISHHYEKADHEIMYDICVSRVPELAVIFEKYLIDVALE